MFGGSNITEIPHGGRRKLATTDGCGHRHFEPDHVYVDLGMGMAAGSTTAVNDNTAFDIAYPGLTCWGRG